MMFGKDRDNKHGVSASASASTGDFLSTSLKMMGSGLPMKMMEEHPEFFLDMLGSMEPVALVRLVSSDPGVFIQLIGEMPEGMLRGLLEGHRDLVCEMIRAMDTDTLMRMMRH